MNKYFISYVTTSSIHVGYSSIQENTFHSTYVCWQNLSYENIDDFERKYRCKVVNIVKLDA